MAELVAKPFVSFFVGRLLNLLSEEWTLLHGVRGQVQQMQIELKRMQCFLTAADARREEGDAIVSSWVAEIRELSCDAEDAIATFVVKVALKRRGGIHHVPKRLSFYSFEEREVRRKVGSEIEDINKKIVDLTRSLQTYGIQSTTLLGESSTFESERVRQLRRSYPHVVEEDIVGLDDDVRVVVDHLVNRNTNYRVVSIWGMGGLGKTTLAKMVYNHIDVRRHFDCVAWAYISQQYNTREVWEEILIKLLSPLSQEDRKAIKELKFDELAEKLHGVQSEKKCLVVLDDIWKREAWDRLSPAFPNTTKAAGDSKILLTTRTREVADSYIDQRCFVHKLRHLTENESFELLQKKASPRGEGMDSTEMMLLGKEMVKHCGGLPLAILVLGGLLATKQTLGEWKKLSRNINCLSKEKVQGGVSVMDVLALSYHDLPYHLKACFLYLSHLPEDESIRREKLVQMWMAEGFVYIPVSTRVGEVEEETMLDIGMSYLNELIQRCIIQVSQLTRYSRRVKFCRLHDLMRDLCLSKAREENFLKVVFIGGDSPHASSSSSLSTTIRRLSVYYLDNRPVGGLHQIQEMCSHYHVRSCQFYFFGNKVKLSDWQHIRSLIKGFKLLRVFDLEHATFIGTAKEKLPKAIGNQAHLRYLSVQGSTIRRLPSSIGNLGLLQTLDLRTSCYIVIPNVLWKLKQLRHLYLPKYFEGAMPCMGKLRLDDSSKLETLVGFDTDKCDVRCFSKLTNLRKLGISHAAPKDLEVILKSQSLSNSNYLLRKMDFKIEGDFQTQEEQSLLRQLLGCHNLHKFFLGGNLAKLPGQFPPNLTKLELYWSRLKEDPMPTLEKLPNLRYLNLWDAYIGKEMVCSAPTPTLPSSQSGGCYGCFPQLKFLCLFHLQNLEEWRVEEGAMPSLLHLEIKRCLQLKKIPDGLRFVTTLQELYIGMSSKELEDRVREGGEDFYKVQHVPSIQISESIVCFLTSVLELCTVSLIYVVILIVCIPLMSSIHYLGFYLRSIAFLNQTSTY